MTKNATNQRPNQVNNPAAAQAALDDVAKGTGTSVEDAENPVVPPEPTTDEDVEKSLEGESKGAIPPHIEEDETETVDSLKVKMTVSAIHTHASGNKDVTLSVSVSDENKVLTNFTPAASLTISVHKEKAHINFFEEGHEYYLDFTKATAPATKVE